MQSALERRQDLLGILCERRHDSVENLAAEFGVSERTIRRDVEQLTLSYPIYTTQGNGGGVHVVDGYRLGRKYLTDSQRGLLERLAARLGGDDFETMKTILKTFSEPKRGN